MADIGSLVGSLLGYRPQQDAARRALAAQNQGASRARAQYDQAYQDVESTLQPWQKFGEQAIQQFQGLGGFKFNVDNIESEPGYAFGLEQGEKAINRAASAGGGFQNTARDKALAKYATGYATQFAQESYQRQQAEFQQNLSWLNTMLGYGNSAASTLARYRAGLGGALGASFDQQGDAIAQNEIARGGIKAQTAHNIGSAFNPAPPDFSRLLGYGSGGTQMQGRSGGSFYTP